MVNTILIYLLVLTGLSLHLHDVKLSIITTEIGFDSLNGIIFGIKVPLAKLKQVSPFTVLYI